MKPGRSAVQLPSEVEQRRQVSDWALAVCEQVLRSTTTGEDMTECIAIPNEVLGGFRFTADTAQEMADLMFRVLAPPIVNVAFDLLRVARDELDVDPFDLLRRTQDFRARLAEQYDT